MFGTWGTRGTPALMALLLAAGCRSDATTAPRIGDDIPGTPIAAGTEFRPMTVDGHERGYTIFVPATVDLEAPARVVMVLHGFPPVDMSRVSGMNEIAAERGFAVVYPLSAYGGQWVHACRCTPNGLLGIDDARYFEAVLDDLDAGFAAGLRDAFVSGFSNGGMMTYSLACRMPGAFAGFGVVGAGMWTWTIDQCRPATPAKLMVFAGTADPQFPWEGKTFLVTNGAEVTQAPIRETIDGWAARNGCDAEPSVTPVEDRFEADGTTVDRLEWSACGAPTVFWRIEGGGHTWPDQLVPFGAALGRVSREISASRELVDFWLGSEG